MLSSGKTVCDLDATSDGGRTQPEQEYGNRME